LEEEVEAPGLGVGEGHRDQSSSRWWTGLTDNYLRVTLASADELLGTSTSVRLGGLEGDTFWITDAGA
jgi:hypothetical protein